MIDMETTLAQRRLARQAVDAYRSMPVVVINGGLVAPKIVGESYHWTTPSGKTRVRYPRAYGWKTRYWPSTLCVEVTRTWLLVAQAATGVFR